MIDLNGTATLTGEQAAEAPRASDHYQALLARILRKHAAVGIIGLGYVGLPLARAFTAGGFPVLGFDIDPAKVAQLNRGASYIGHIPDRVLGNMRDRGFQATTRFERL